MSHCARLALRLPVATTPNMRWMVETGQPRVVPDVSAYPDWVELPGTEWIRSQISAPIRVNGEVIGFLNLDSNVPNRFCDADAEPIQSFANQAAAAIRNADLYDALRQQAEDLERRVEERTAELEQERAQLQTILDTMSEGVIYDEKLSVRYINRALTELTGYRIDEWKGFLEPLRSQSMSSDELQQMVHSLYEGVGSVHKRELRFRRKDGTEFDAHLTCTHVLNSDGDVVGAVTVVRDVSQEKVLERQKAQFVAYASHELRTPITNLKTRLYLMRQQPERMEDHWQILEDVTERMRRLVEDLLDMSRFDRGTISIQRRNVILQPLVRDVVRVQQPEAERKNLTLVCHLPADPLRIFADPERIVQVVTNLVTNAINYTPAGGNVTIDVMPAWDAESGDQSAIIAVEDTGIGIDDMHLPYIFQPFYRVGGTIEGTGLGLSITQQIVELHGGEITVDSVPGQGSTFRVRLPLASVSPMTALSGTGGTFHRP